MQPLNVVLLQNDSGVAQSLVSALGSSASVCQVKSLGELRNTIEKHVAGIAILDMEAASISDVEHLSREFPKARIVCTHRFAAADMWAAALNAGAADICPPSEDRKSTRLNSSH